MNERIREFLATAPPDLAEWAARTSAELDAPRSVSSQGPPPKRRKVPVALVLLIAVPLLIWGVYKIGAPPESDDSALPQMSTGETAPPLDVERVAQLEAQVEADPDDVAAMSELGKLHLVAGDLENSGRWQQRILADHPDDVDARLALGVVLFNQGDLEAAEEQWVTASELAPEKAEPHYNLGFLHLATDPPDMDLVEEHWNKVVELDPESSMAETISTHLGSFSESDPTANPEPLEEP